MFYISTIGAVRLLEHLKKNNIPIALATGSDQDNYEVKTKRWHDLFKPFHHKVLGGSDIEVVHGKPAPDIFLIAAKRFPDNPDASKVCSFIAMKLRTMQTRFFIQYSCIKI